MRFQCPGVRQPRVIPTYLQQHFRMRREVTEPPLIAAMPDQLGCGYPKKRAVIAMQMCKSATFMLLKVFACIPVISPIVA